MTQGRKGIIVIGGVFATIMLGLEYNRHLDNKIKENLTIVLATVYSVDNNVKYRHQRIKFFFRANPDKLDSSQLFRDDLNSNCFWNLKGKQIALALDSLNPRTNGYLLITNADFEKFGIRREELGYLNASPLCDQ